MTTYTQKPASSRRKLVLATAFFVAAAGALAWWLWPDGGTGAQTQEFVTTAPDGTERRVRLEGLGSGRENDPMQEVVGAYFAATTKAERDAILDDIIDKSEEARKELGDLPTQIREGATEGEIKKTLGDGTPGEKKIVMMRPNDKSMAENVPAEHQARMAEFSKAVNDRRKERGLPPGPVVIINKRTVS